MKRFLLPLSLLCLTLSLMSQALAQTSGPPKVMLFEREELKPGAAEGHERESNNFVRMLAHAKEVSGEKSYYRIGMTPVAGNTNEVMYILPFNSLDELSQSQKDIERWMSRPGPMNSFVTKIRQEHPSNQSGVNDDFHLTQRDMIGLRMDDLTYNPRANVGEARYMEMTIWRVKPGELQNFLKVGHLIVNAHKEAKTDTHFVTYRIMGGTLNGTFITLSSLKTLDEMMPDPAQQAAFAKALGDNAKEVDKLAGESLVNSETNIYAFRPTMSNPQDNWVAADSAFWKQEMPAPPPQTATSARQGNGKKRQRQ